MRHSQRLTFQIVGPLPCRTAQPGGSADKNLPTSDFSFTFAPMNQNQHTDTATDERFMRMALAEAAEALAQDEVPIGAVVVADGMVVGRGHNLTETLRDVTAHAEMQAITAAAASIGGKYLDACTLYVTVEPCIMCAGAIGWSQMGRIVYGAPDPKRGFQTYAPRAFHPRASVTQGILEEECAQLMRDFFRRKR